MGRAVPKALIGGAYSHIRVLLDEFLLKSTVMTTNLKKNSSGRTRIYEYPPPPPPSPINALVTALSMGQTLDCYYKGIEFTQLHRPEEAIPDSNDNCEPGFRS